MAVRSGPSPDDAAELASARRLLSAAIRMYFAEEDELAVRVVASAAYGLFRELKAKRGQDAEMQVAVDQVGTLPLLVLAHSAHVELTDESIWPEGDILWVYYNALEGTTAAVQDELKELVVALESLTPDQRLRFCTVWIQRLKQAGAEEGGTVH